MHIHCICWIQGTSQIKSPLTSTFQPLQGSVVAAQHVVKCSCSWIKSCLFMLLAVESMAIKIFLFGALHYIIYELRTLFCSSIHAENYCKYLTLIFWQQKKTNFFCTLASVTENQHYKLFMNKRCVKSMKFKRIIKCNLREKKKFF